MPRITYTYTCYSILFCSCFYSTHSNLPVICLDLHVGCLVCLCFLSLGWSSIILNSSCIYTLLHSLQNNICETHFWISFVTNFFLYFLPGYFKRLNVSLRGNLNNYATHFNPCKCIVFPKCIFFIFLKVPVHCVSPCPVEDWGPGLGA